MSTDSDRTDGDRLAELESRADRLAANLDRAREQQDAILAALERLERILLGLTIGTTGGAVLH